MKASVESSEDVHRRIIQRWSLGASTVFILGVLQLVFGRFAEMEASAVWWLGIHLVPGLALLVAGVLADRYAVWLTRAAAVKATLRWITAFWITCLLTLLFIPLVLRNSDRSVDTYISYSYGWLTPVHLLALAGIFQHFFTKRYKRMPDAEMLRDYAKMQWKKALQTKQLIRASCLESIADNRLEDALKSMELALQEKPGELDRFVVLSGSYKDLLRMIQANKVDAATARQSLADITKNLINLAETIDQ